MKVKLTTKDGSVQLMTEGNQVVPTAPIILEVMPARYKGIFKNDQEYDAFEKEQLRMQKAHKAKGHTTAPTPTTVQEMIDLLSTFKPNASLKWTAEIEHGRGVSVADHASQNSMIVTNNGNVVKFAFSGVETDSQ